MPYYPIAIEKAGVYTLTGPDGTAATFNDATSASYVGMISELTGLDSAEVRENFSDLAASDGRAHGDFFFGGRPLTITAQVYNHASVKERAARIDLARRASVALRGDATLAWVPSLRQENFVGNPRAANDLTGIGSVSSALVLTRITSGTPTGFTTGTSATGSVSATSSVHASYGLAGTTGTGGWPVVGGKTYGARIAHAITTITSGAVSSLMLRIYWFTSSGAPASTSFTTVATQASPVTGTTYVQSGTAVAPDDAAYATIRATAGITNPTNYTATTAGAVFQRDTAPSSYADGDTAGWYWHGIAHTSQSGDYIPLFVPVRRQQPFRESGGWAKEIQILLVSQYSQIFGQVLKTSAALTAGGAAVVLENQGNYPAYPVVTITGPGAGTFTGLTVSDGTRQFKTTGLTLAANEVVQFDLLNHTGVFTVGARAGQSANRYIDFTLSTWPYVAMGNNNFTLTGTGTATATVQWRDTWA